MYIYNNIREGVDPLHRTAISYFWTLNSPFLGSAIDPFSTGALVINRTVQGRASIEKKAHLPSLLDIYVFDTSFPFGELRMITGGSCFFWIQQRTTIALCLISVRMGM